MTYEEIYDALCVGCPRERICHEECEVCDEFLALEMKEEEVDGTHQG